MVRAEQICRMEKGNREGRVEVKLNAIQSTGSPFCLFIELMV